MFGKNRQGTERGQQMQTSSDEGHTVSSNVHISEIQDPQRRTAAEGCEQSHQTIASNTTMCDLQQSRPCLAQCEGKLADLWYTPTGVIINHMLIAKRMLIQHLIQAGHQGVIINLCEEGQSLLHGRSA